MAERITVTHLAAMVHRVNRILGHCDVEYPLKSRHRCCGYETDENGKLKRDVNHGLTPKEGTIVLDGDEVGWKVHQILRSGGVREVGHNYRMSPREAYYVLRAIEDVLDHQTREYWKHKYRRGVNK